MNHHEELETIKARAEALGYPLWGTAVELWHRDMHSGHAGTVQGWATTDLRTLHNLISGYGYEPEPTDDTDELRDMISELIEDHFEDSLW